MPAMPPLCDASVCTLPLMMLCRHHAALSHHPAEVFAFVLKRMRDKKSENINRNSYDVIPAPFRMTVTVKLYSDATTARRDLTGEPCQVYETVAPSADWIVNQVRAGNALSIFRVDGNCHWLHIVCPQVVNDIYGNPEWIVGNCSDVLGEFSLIKVHVSKLRYFPIIGQDADLPV